MKRQLRKNKNGFQYYSFIYFDEEEKKNVRIPRSEIQKRFGRDITTAEDAEMAMKVLNAKYESLIEKIEKRLEWEQEFYNFSGLLKTYKKKQMKAAPNSYKNNLHYLKHYVLHYFLNLKKCNNLELWSGLYDDFRDWLEYEARLLKKSDCKLSYGAKNHCIKALNTFMRQVYNDRKTSNLILCQKFPSHMLGERSVDDVVSSKEMESVYKQLVKANHLEEALFFRMLYFTGMRTNEGRGISIADLFTGEVQDEGFHNTLAAHSFQYKGYIVLMSQPQSKSQALRGKMGKIVRKPLKGRKKISEKFARIVILPDEKLWKGLSELYNQKIDDFERGLWGNNPSDYALFENIKSTSTTRLKKAFEKANLRYRSWHCLRHSCATNVVGKTGDYQLARRWLGHTSMQVIERYVHTHQALVRKTTQTKKNEKGFRKIEVGD